MFIAAVAFSCTLHYVHCIAYVACVVLDGNTALESELGLRFRDNLRLNDRLSFRVLGLRQALGFGWGSFAIVPIVLLAIAMHLQLTSVNLTNILCALQILCRVASV